MTEKPTKQQKAAKTLGREHFAAIGAEGGKKTPGTFASKKGLAKKAGIRSGQARKLKALDKEIESLEMRIGEAMRFTDTPPADIKELEAIKDNLVLERDILDAEYRGVLAINVGGVASEFNNSIDGTPN